MPSLKSSIQWLRKHFCLQLEITLTQKLLILQSANWNLNAASLLPTVMETWWIQQNYITKCLAELAPTSRDAAVAALQLSSYYRGPDGIRRIYSWVLNGNGGFWKGAFIKEPHYQRRLLCIRITELRLSARLVLGRNARNSFNVRRWDWEFVKLKIPAKKGKKCRSSPEVELGIKRLKKRTFWIKILIQYG